MLANDSEGHTMNTRSFGHLFSCLLLISSLGGLLVGCSSKSVVVEASPSGHPGTGVGSGLAVSSPLPAASHPEAVHVGSPGPVLARPSPRPSPAPSLQALREEVFVAGRSAEGREIKATSLGAKGPRTLFLGAFHGDEPASQVVLERFLSYLRKNPRLLEGHRAVLCASVNPDGLILGSRENSRGVDINRNFPASNWKETPREPRYWGGPEAASEEETRAVIRLIETFRPDRIVTVHSPYGVVNFDGPARDLANAMGVANGYPVVTDIGYETPGSFGTYAGVDRAIPTVTLELRSGNGDVLWMENREALKVALTFPVAEEAARP